MARIRSIKPTFFTSPTIGELPLSARLTFIGLWTFVDDAGRGRDDIRLIKAAVWPLDDGHRTRRIESDLAALEKAHLIERYLVDGRPYLRIRSWAEHQRINRPSPSLMPVSPEESVNCHGAVTDGSPPEGNKERKGIRNSDSSARSTQNASQEAVAAAPPESEPLPTSAPWKTDPLVQRWCTDVARNTRPPYQAATWRVVAHLRRYVDEATIDETIGRLSRLDKRPTKPAYLLTTVTAWAAERNIAIPPLEAK